MAVHTTTGLLQAARERLAGSSRERLGEWTQGRRILGIGRAPRIVPVAEAWHVGVLLIGEDRVFATGEVLRARHDAIRGYTAEAQRARAERAAAAFRGGFAEAEVLHLGWSEMDAAAVDRGAGSGILSLQDGVPHITWSHTGPPRPLEDYLDDMLSLR